MTFAHSHEAVLDLAAGADPAAPGAAVTVALCGHWQHEGACRWPHRTEVVSVDGPVLRVRVDFDAPPGEVEEVRSRIAGALGQGELLGPDGRESRWSLRVEGAARPGSVGK